MIVYLICLIVVGISYILYHILQKHQNYWKYKNVPYVKPLPLFGNYKDYIFLKKHISEVMQEICQQFPNEPYVGSFYGTDPALIVKDPNLVKLVMSKEFYYCNGREISDYNHKEMMAKNMFFASGDEWKVLRTNLTPLFTSAKLKNMFYLIQNSSDTFESLLEKEIRMNSRVDVRNLLSRYTIDCITACAFGLNAETMKSDVNNAFVAMGNIIFNSSNYQAFKGICRLMWPELFYGLGFKMFPDDVSQLFNKIISGVFKNRQELKSSRNDFVDLILTWKQNDHISGDSMNNIKTDNKKKVNIEVNEELLLAQCILFFAAGFETTATSMTFLLYELAKNKSAQDKVIEEVDEYFVKNKTIEYECINTMPYTEACLEESLRLYPVLGILTREVMHEYSLPTGLSFKKGDRIHIPVYQIQRNPDFFPDPDVFNPNRFFGNEKANIKPYTYMPFGEGPRICIGMRFAKMPIYAAFLKIFKDYRVELAENMPHKLTLNPNSLITQPIGGIHLKFVPRKA